MYLVQFLNLIHKTSKIQVKWTLFASLLDFFQFAFLECLVNTVDVWRSGVESLNALLLVTGMIQFPHGVQQLLFTEEF